MSIIYVVTPIEWLGMGFVGVFFGKGLSKFDVLSIIACAQCQRTVRGFVIVLIPVQDLVSFCHNHIFHSCLTSESYSCLSFGVLLSNQS